MNSRCAIVGTVVVALLVPSALVAVETRIPKELGTAASGQTTDVARQGSYILGFSWANNMNEQTGGFVDVDSLVRGIQDGMAGKEPAMAEHDMRQTMMAFQQLVMSARQQASVGNLSKAEAWLDENKKKEGVTTTASGLQYTVVKAGTGDKPHATDKVTVHYHGTLTDGTVFDSSKTRGQPASFELNRVIPGWSEGVQLMSAGASYRFFVHPKLAYGERNVGKIPPNSALIFDVELLAFEASGPANPALVFPASPK